MPQTTERRWIMATLGSVASWIIGLPVGFVAATLYQNWMYPPEPDPVHFDVGGVFLLGWALVGIAGTAVSASTALFAGRTKPAQPVDAIGPVKQIVSTADRGIARDIRFQSVERPFEFQSPFDGQDFVLMLVVNDSTVTDAERYALCKQIVQQGCRFAACAGHACSDWHDCIDFASISLYPDPLDEPFLMTIGHEKRSIKDIVWEFLMCSSFEDFWPERFFVFFVGNDPRKEAKILREIKRQCGEPV